ncbi:MAG TPA: class II D-tagatose-bisphosphate aldolase, non-catalytic subunit [Anaeromyxobacter sp.]|nr:class II D-tagatose-bisphosphate aldolase, non-catalytic subunit [Anaeromyxobacter sp.]HVP61129.1 class II D-tagatose-bisphosphate aldolase, non-catalytic subunit [Myxococcaceae bacterium]
MRSNRQHVLGRLFPDLDHSGRSGVVSVCCAHPLAIESGLRQAREAGEPLVVEATCNQVNQEGGYTGLRPDGFRRLVGEVCDRVGFPRGRLVLGGDHLGPNPWRQLPAEQAMSRAEAMVAAFVGAGFTKVHLDASMPCRDDGAAPPQEVIARRAARLAKVAEGAAPSPAALSYVIGSEVPVPGGSRDAPDPHHVTTPEAVRATWELHRAAFAALGLEAAFARVIAVVVQPGLEFSNDDVVVYERSRAAPLRAALPGLGRLVYEAHSTDHQPPEALAALVEDGFAILKIGPALTFAMREALYALDHVAEVLFEVPPGETLRAAMERLMIREPRHWAPYAHGTSGEQRVLRHYGLSDRLRYYWPFPEATAAVELLLHRLQGRSVPRALVSQYLPLLHEEVAGGHLPATPQRMVLASMERIFRGFLAPCATAPA